MARELKDKVIVITGASSGIGAATAIACARAGMDVVLTARRGDRLRAVAGQVEQLGRRAEVIADDITAPGLSQRLFDTAEEAFGRFDVVFANAGYGVEATVVDTTEFELRRVFDVNFFACVELLQTAANRLKAKNRPGHLLMCSSCLGKFAMPLHGAYSATKAAQSQICRSMKLELEGWNIDVSCVYPITTETEFIMSSQRLGRWARRKSDITDHAPRMFIQSADRIADAVVRCLRRPKPEVWTSFIVRTVAAVMVFCPRFLDLVMRRFVRHLVASDPSVTVVDDEAPKEAAGATTAESN
jgi:short-subunit dehydrogenase